MNSPRWRARNDHIRFGNADRNGDQYEKDTTTKTRQLRKHDMKLMQFNWKNQLFTMEYRKEFELKHGKRRWKKVKEDGKTYYQMLNKTTTN